MPKISIIMPTYNVQDYLPAAMESVINQTFSDIEIICINDGSTDNSLQILEDYARKDNRIKIIDQQNQGVSAARNKGIENANGEYIMFLDPDDTYDLTLCEKVVHKIDAETPDIVMWGHNIVINGEVKRHNCYIKDLTILTKKNTTLIEQLKIQVYIWDKAFKRSFIKDNKINFPIGINNAEDLVFCLTSYYCKPKYSFIQESLVNYCDGRDEAATKKFEKDIKNDFEAYKFLFNTKIYQNQNNRIKIVSTNHFLGGSIFYWRTVKDKKIKNQYAEDIERFLEFVRCQFNIFELFQMTNYKKLKHLLFKYRHKKFFDLFDIRTTETEKDFVVFGQKLHIRRKSKKYKISQENTFRPNTNIVMLLDEKYFFCTYVALLSMKKTKDKNSNYNLFLLTKEV